MFITMILNRAGIRTHKTKVSYGVPLPQTKVSYCAALPPATKGKRLRHGECVDAGTKEPCDRIKNSYEPLVSRHDRLLFAHRIPDFLAPAAPMPPLRMRSNHSVPDPVV